MTLNELAERVERAEGPDRELDAEIFRAIGAPVPFQFATKMVALSFDEKEQCYFAPIGDMRVRYESPAYTASLDSAMTLVPEGWGKSVTDADNGKHALGEVWSDDANGCARANTWPLALTAAALRARAREEG